MWRHKLGKQINKENNQNENTNQTLNSKQEKINPISYFMDGMMMVGGFYLPIT